MNLEFYKVVHIVAAFVLLSALGVLYTAYARKEHQFKHRSLILSAHGLCLILIMISGFGMLAKLGIMSQLPMWVILKLLIWLAIGILPIFAKRFQRYAYSVWFLTLALAAFAVMLAIYH